MRSRISTKQRVLYYQDVSALAILVRVFACIEDGDTRRSCATTIVRRLISMVNGKVSPSLLLFLVRIHSDRMSSRGLSSGRHRTISTQQRELRVAYLSCIWGGFFGHRRYVQVHQAPAEKLEALRRVRKNLQMLRGNFWRSAMGDEEPPEVGQETSETSAENSDVEV